MLRTLPAILIIGFLALIAYNLDLASKALAFSSSSTNFNLEAEFGIFGGSKSSASYTLTDTGGGFAVGFGSSTNYGTGSGFQYNYQVAEIPEIIFAISTTTVNLGTLSTASVSTSSHTITVTANSSGYNATVVEDGNLRSGGNDVNDVSGGTVDAGSEEYGLATSKSGQNITQDTSCGPDPDNASAITGSPQTVASAATSVTGDSTTLCYAASISGTTPTGSYTHVLTYIATGTF
ncbi:MAG: hypothetical protein WD187_02990 [Candidatus Woykebacteria bacterium]